MNILMYDPKYNKLENIFTKRRTETMYATND